MKLKRLLSGVDIIENAVGSAQITGIVLSSRAAGSHMLYVALSGRSDNGHLHIDEALASGAYAVIDDRRYLKKGCLLVKDCRRALAVMSANLYGNPAERLVLVGVTGTAGKTSVCYHIKNILGEWGKECGLIGTVENARGQDTAAAFTTPPPPELHRMLAGFLDSGISYVVMEASSQALDQKRLYGVEFEVGVFTNLGHDHLDYHGNMEEYFAAKRSLFEQSRFAAINADDPYGRRLEREMGQATCFSLNKGAVTAKNIEYHSDCTRFALSLFGCDYPVRVGAGEYSVYNALAAAAAAVELSVPSAVIAAGISRPLAISGRMERVDVDTPFSVYIDFAHTPEELSQALSAARQLCRGRVIALFGCGGDRDREKRAPMAALSCREADYSVFTSCNPRHEDPRAILNEMLLGVTAQARYAAVLSRRAAIELALRVAAAGDLVLLAGKGHELYQIFGDRLLPFDERAEVISAYNRIALCGK